MRNFSYILLLCLYFCPTIQAKTTPTVGDIIIYAFDNADASTGTNDYIVIENRSATTMDMTGFSIKTFSINGGNSSNVNYSFPSGTMLAPGQKWLVASSQWSGGLPSSIKGELVDGNYGTNNFSPDGYIAIGNGTVCTDAIKHGNHTGAGSLTGTALDTFCPAATSLTTTTDAVDTKLFIRTTYTAFGATSDFSRQTETAFALPIELAIFQAQVQDHDVHVKWTTASESNNDRFELQEKISGDFTTIKEVKGAGTSITSQEYTEVLRNLPAGKHTFRLKQVDFDGSVRYSDVLDVLVELTSRYEMRPAYPNPFNPSTSFNLAVAKGQNVHVSVYNMMGQEVAVLHRGFLEANASNTFNFDATSLPSGMYLFRAIGENFSATQSVILTK